MIRIDKLTGSMASIAALVKRSKWAFIVLGIMFGTICSFAFFRFLPNVDLFSRYVERVGFKDAFEQTVICEGNAVSQDIEFSNESISSISLKLAPIALSLESNVQISILDYEEGTTAYAEPLSVYFIREDEGTSFHFSDLIVEQGKTYKLTIEVFGEATEIAVYYSPYTIWNSEIELTDGTSIVGGVYYSERGHRNSQFSIAFALIMISFSVIVSLLVYSCINIELRRIELCDWILLGFMYLLCCFFFSFGSDIRIIDVYAREMISVIESGDFFSFYDIAFENDMIAQTGTWVNYNILMYLIASIMVLPCVLFEKITGHNFPQQLVPSYYSIFVLIALFYSAYLIWKIAKKYYANCVNISPGVFAFFYLSSVILALGTATFVQLDVFVLIMILWAYDKYLGKKYIWFSLIMSLAIAMKTIPIVIMIPLALLAHKRITLMLRDILLGLVAPVLNAVLFGRSPAYQFVQSATDFKKYLVSGGVDFGFAQGSLFVIGFLIICTVCYSVDSDTESLPLYAATVCAISFGLMIVFSMWHPQWIIFVIPFFTMSTISLKNRLLLLLNVGVEVFFALFVFGQWDCAVDNYMVNNGVLPFFTHREYQGVCVREVYDKIDVLAFPCIYSVFIGFTLIYLVYMVVLVRSWNTEKVNWEPERPILLMKPIFYSIVLIGFLALYCFAG